MRRRFGAPVISFQRPRGEHGIHSQFALRFSRFSPQAWSTSSHRLFNSSRSFQRRDPSSYAVYLVSDDKYVVDQPDFEDKVIAAIRGGVTIVQLRLKKVNTGYYVEKASSLKAKMADAGFAHIPLIIDDRLDVVLAADCDGLHVGEGDLDPATARKFLGKDKILGVSTYGIWDVVQHAVQSGADYVAGGGVFASTTKTTNARGSAHLHDLKARLVHEYGEQGRHVPLIAIGGVNTANAYECAFAGADGLACVSAFFEAAGHSPVDGAEKVATQLKAAAGQAIVDKERFKGVSIGSGRPRKDAVDGASLVAAVETLRQKKPLIQCLTNYVSMDVMANVLLSAGASPAMVHAKEEAKEFAQLASAVSINPGTLSSTWTDSFLDVAEFCTEKDIVWVLDPVGNGATQFRNEVFTKLLQKRPSIVRGNPAEISVCCAQMAVEASCAGIDESSDCQSGVDSLIDSHAVDKNLVDALARKIGGVVCMTGSVDYVTDGGANKFYVCHDVPELQMITAAGCSLSSLAAAFASVDPDRNLARGTAHACAYFSLCADLAAKELRHEARDPCNGDAGHVPVAAPGALRTRLMDYLCKISPQQMRAFCKIQQVR